MDRSTQSEGLKAQRKYVEKLKTEKFDWDLLVGDAFVRGMRDIGYKSTSFALAELIDNSVQAAATRVDVVFGYDGNKTPTKIAVIDDGYGMEPTMVRASLVWGAGTRASNRSGFGKYGYGLPSASVSQCRRVTVYSKTTDGTWNSSYLDIDEIGNGEWTKAHRIQVPAEKMEKPPLFVIEFLKKQKRWPSMDHGTVVVWERLDRVSPHRREELRNSLITDLGVVYRNFLVNTPMTVDGVLVEPCDPLFLTEGFRYYDLDADRAIELPPANIEVKDKATGEVTGHLRIRFARLPSTFFRRPEAKQSNKPGKTHMNERLNIADANNGIIFTRNGRQIDVVRPPRNVYNFNATTDRFWGVEVDFDATLDEEFAITTSKQQVKPSERMWEILKDRANLWNAIGTMRADYQKQAKVVADRSESDPTNKRPSVEAIEYSEKFRTTKKPTDSDARRKEAQLNLEREAHRRAAASGLDPRVVEKDMLEQQVNASHAVELEDLPGAPFFRCVQQGGQRVLYLNSSHPFYTDLYRGQRSTPKLRAGLEVLLWALGEAEVEADPESDRRQFYSRERASVWSPFLSDALTALETIEVIDNAGNEGDEA